MSANKTHLAGLRVNALLTALLLALCLMGSSLAAGLPEESESENENIPLDTLAVSRDAALALVRETLGADDSWTIASVELDEENGTLYYSVVCTDPVGDAHLRLVDAQTGAIEVRSMAADPGRDGENDHRDEDDGKDGDDADDQRGEQDEQADQKWASTGRDENTK